MTDAEIDHLLDEYVEWMQSWNASANTVKVRRRVMRARLREWGGAAGFTPANIQHWLGSPDLSPWSRATYHAHVKEFCGWLYSTDRLAENPIVGFKAPRSPAHRPRPLSEAEVEVVLTHARGRVRDWIMLALHAGLRAHEIAKIRGEDITAEGIWVEGKGGKQESIPPHSCITEMAQRYPARGYWFPGRKNPHIAPETVTTKVGALLYALGIEGSVHRFRHVYGTRLLRAGVNIRVVQQLMRHSSLETTAAYTAVSDDEKRAAIDRLPQA